MTDEDRLMKLFNFDALSLPDYNFWLKFTEGQIIRFRKERQQDYDLMLSILIEENSRYFDPCKPLPVAAPRDNVGIDKPTYSCEWDEFGDHKWHPWDSGFTVIRPDGSIDKAMSMMIKVLGLEEMFFILSDSGVVHMHAQDHIDAMFFGFFSVFDNLIVNGLMDSDRRADS